MGSAADTRNTIMYSLIVCCSFIVFIIVMLSFTLTKIDEISLVKNWMTQTIYYDATYANAGRYFTGPFITFIPFTRHRLLIDFSEEIERGDAGGNRMECWAKEGTNVYLDISFYIRFQESKLLEFYKEFGEKYLDFVVRSSYVAIKETTVNYQTIDFFTKRNEISQGIRDAINSKYKEHFYGAVAIEEIQLRRITYDENFESALVSKLVELQQLSVLKNKKELYMTTNSTAQIINTYQNQIDVILAEGRSDGATKDAELRGTSLQEMSQKMNGIYKTLSTELAVTGDALKQYMYMTEIELHENLGDVYFTDAKAQKVKII